MNDLHSGSPREPRKDGSRSWRDLAERTISEGIAKYGNLNISVPELASWIELVRSRKRKKEDQGNGHSGVPPNLNDLYLAAALAKGQPRAWQLWRDQLELPIVRWMSRLVGGARLADDIFSDLTGDMFAGKLEQYRGDAALKTWLTAVARNRLADRLESESRRGVSLELWNSGQPMSHPDRVENDFVEDLTGRLYSEMATKALRDELKRLLEGERLLIRQYFENEIPMTVLAGEYGVNRTQVGRRIRAIRDKIRTALINRGIVDLEARARSPRSMMKRRRRHVPALRNDGRACRVCGGQGHNRRTCGRI